MDVKQSRMARAALGWSTDDLAAAASLSKRTVLRFEGGETVQPETVQAMRSALEANRVRFIDKGQFAGGVTVVKAG